MKEVVNKLRYFREELCQKSDEEIFAALHKLDSEYSGNRFYDLNINGTLINLGTEKKSIPLISHAIKRLKFLHDKNPSDKLVYDIGNGFLSMADIRSGQSPDISLLMIEQASKPQALAWG